MSMTRKDFLKKSCLLGAAAATAGSCALIYDPELLVGTIAELDQAGFLVKEFNWDQIFITQQKGKIMIFSLVCTHKKCTVEWQPRENIFQCPCHEGQYDAQGQVLDGPPPAPLAQLRAEIRGEEIWVLRG